MVIVSGPMQRLRREKRILHPRLSGNKETENFSRSAGIFFTSRESSLMRRKLRLGGSNHGVNQTVTLQSVAPSSLSPSNFSFA
jgi:hypothetical protein